jgi:hypothetical protein
MSTPTFDEWQLLSEKERAEIASRWSGYTGGGEELVKEIVADFRAKYGSLPGVDVNPFPGIHHGGSWVSTSRTRLFSIGAPCRVRISACSCIEPWIQISCPLSSEMVGPLRRALKPSSTVTLTKCARDWGGLT